jgi:uncharacterized membrane protein YoaK (UPF0700 family)
VAGLLLNLPPENGQFDMEDMSAGNDRGLARVVSAQLAALLLQTALWPLLALLIHPPTYGNLIWLVSIATILSTLCTLSLGKTVITPQQDGKLLSSSVAVVFVLSLIAGAVVSVALEPAIGLLTVGLSPFSITVHLELARRSYGGYLRT